MAPTADGGGYWLVGADGGIFAFGDASFHGSTGGQPLNAPIVGWPPRPTVTGTGWWRPTAASSPSATPPFEGSAGSLLLQAPIVGMAPDHATGGYWLVAADGGVFAYDAPFDGGRLTGPRRRQPAQMIDCISEYASRP